MSNQLPISFFAFYIRLLGTYSGKSRISPTVGEDRSCKTLCRLWTTIPGSSNRLIGAVFFSHRFQKRYVPPIEQNGPPPPYPGVGGAVVAPSAPPGPSVAPGNAQNIAPSGPSHGYGQGRGHYNRSQQQQQQQQLQQQLQQNQQKPQSGGQKSKKANKGHNVEMQQQHHANNASRNPRVSRSTSGDL